jgi:hypothetical protein
MDATRQFLFLLCVAGLLAIAALVQGVRTAGFLRGAERTYGTIESVGSVNVADRGYPVWIRFEDGAGTSHRVEVRTHKAPTGSLSHPYREGHSIAMVYDPSAPATTARVGRFLDLWQWALIWGLGSLVSGVSGLVVWAQRPRPVRELHRVA